MKIKQVEELVGITSKNIRFYEEEGLLCPPRAENGYREYHQQEIEALMKIKLLRKVGVPVEEIKNLFEREISLNECLDSQLHRLEKEQDNLKNMYSLVSMILEDESSIDDLNTERWLETVGKLEKEGTSFVDLSKEDIHMKKKRGVLLSGIIIVLLILLYLAVLVYMYLDKGMPLLMLLCIGAGTLVVIGSIVYVMKSRMKEIDGGEEDEAAKY